MADSTSRALLHLIRAAEQVALALAAGLEELGERTHARATLLAALRAEERRWLARADADPAAAHVAEIMGALADVLEPATRAHRSRDESAARDTRRKFDPPRRRWDTRAPWRS